MREYRLRWNQRNPSYKTDYKRKRRRENINVRLASNLRRRMHSAVKSGSAVRDLGCSLNTFKLYIENQFEDGMLWDNYGNWHLDHVLPLASFDLSNRQQFLEATHYLNYQPLWAFDNKQKGAKF